jgi:hypothetical protein
MHARECVGHDADALHFRSIDGTTTSADPADSRLERAPSGAIWAASVSIRVL